MSQGDWQEAPEALLSIQAEARALAEADHHLRAWQLQKEALATYEEELGADHPAILMLISDAVVSLGYLGGHKDTYLMVERALKMSDRVLNTGHPDAAYSVWYLLNTLQYIHHGAVHRQLFDKLSSFLDRNEGDMACARDREVRQLLLNSLDQDPRFF